MGYTGNPTPKIVSTINSSFLKATSINFVDSYYNEFLQISLAVSTALIGLYALVFIEIIKALNERTSKHKLYKYIKYALLFSAIIPMPILLGSMYNIYSTFQIYQGLSELSQAYITFSNYSVYSNSTLSIYYNISVTTSNGIIEINSKNLKSDLNQFPSILNSTTSYLALGVLLFILNLISYTIFMFYTEPIVNDNIPTLKMPINDKKDNLKQSKEKPEILEPKPNPDKIDGPDNGSNIA